MIEEILIIGAIFICTFIVSAFLVALAWIAKTLWKEQRINKLFKKIK